MTGRRALVVACAALVGSAALLWGGSSTVPWLTGIALLALAGVAAVVATGGVVRRVLGALLGGVGGVVASLSGHWLGAAGGVVLLGVGAFVLVREPALPRYGARGDRAADVDPDLAAWQELDEGHDPTADTPSQARDDPGDGPPNRAG